ncbi:MAG TPA: hypothetical protein VIX11_04260 [Candidatus Acidoferrum sp.]
MSTKQLTVNQCQFQNARGQRCNMLIDAKHRHGTGQATLCAFHAERLRARVPLVDPEVLAAELLGDINSFATADEVNLFLGNLVKQLARKRIARRDAIALAYISQLLLNTQTGMAREAAAAEEAEKHAAHDRMIASLYTRRRDPSSSGNQQSTGAAAAAQPVNDDPQRAA